MAVKKSKFQENLNWEISKTPIYNSDGTIITGYNKIARNDDDSTIAVMKQSFHPMTIAEFTDVVERVAKQVGADVAGYEDWRSGDKDHIITAQIKLTKDVHIIGSKMEGYMTIGVGFDGSRSFFIGHTQEFLRCTNQFGRIIKNFTSRLTRNNLLRVEDIVSNIYLYEEYEKSLYKSLEKMYTVKVDEKLVQECVARLVKLTEEERLDSGLITTQKRNKMDDILASMRTEMADVGHNALGIFNGATHYTTHIMNSRGGEYFGNMRGAKGAINDAAFEFCNELIIQ